MRPHSLNLCLFFLVALFLAGCTAQPGEMVEGPGDGDAEGVGPNEALAVNASKDPITVSKEGSTLFGVGLNVPGQDAYRNEVQATPCLEVEVLEGQTALVAEVAWTDYTQRLLLRVLPPGSGPEITANSPSLPLFPVTHLRVEVPDPEAGTWQVCANADGGNVKIQYTLYGTLLAGQVPETFTAAPEQPISA